MKKDWVLQHSWEQYWKVVILLQWILKWCYLVKQHYGLIVWYLIQILQCTCYSQQQKPMSGFRNKSKSIKKFVGECRCGGVTFWSCYKEEIDRIQGILSGNCQEKIKNHAVKRHHCLQDGNVSWKIHWKQARTELNREGPLEQAQLKAGQCIPPENVSVLTCCMIDQVYGTWNKQVNE